MTPGTGFGVEAGAGPPHSALEQAQGCAPPCPPSSSLEQCQEGGGLHVGQLDLRGGSGHATVEHGVEDGTAHSQHEPGEGTGLWSAWTSATRTPWAQRARVGAVLIDWQQCTPVTLHLPFHWCPVQSLSSLPWTQLSPVWFPVLSPSALLAAGSCTAGYSPRLSEIKAHPSSQRLCLNSGLVPAGNPLRATHSQARKAEASVGLLPGPWPRATRGSRSRAGCTGLAAPPRPQLQVVVPIASPPPRKLHVHAPPAPLLPPPRLQRLPSCLLPLERLTLDGHRGPWQPGPRQPQLGHHSARTGARL